MGRRIHLMREEEGEWIQYVMTTIGCPYNLFSRVEAKLKSVNSERKMQRSKVCAPEAFNSFASLSFARHLTFSEID